MRLFYYIETKKYLLLHCEMCDFERIWALGGGIIVSECVEKGVSS